MQELREGLLLLPRPHTLPVGVQQQSGGERADDAGQADPFGGEGQREADRQAEHHEHLAPARPSREPDDRAREPVPEPHRDPEEGEGLENDPRDREPGEPRPARPGRRHEAGDHRQHHEPQDVVQDGRAENHLPLPAVQGAQVLQDPGRDADARGRQRRSDEQVGERGSLGQQPSRGPPPEDERRHHADCGHQRGGRPDPGEGPQVRLQPDVEQQDEHPDLGQHVKRGVAAHEGDPAFTEEEREQVCRADAREELAEDRRLPPPLGQEPAALRRQDEERQPEQDRPGAGRGVGRGRPCHGGNREKHESGRSRPQDHGGTTWARLPRGRRPRRDQAWALVLTSQSARRVGPEAAHPAHRLILLPEERGVPQDGPPDDHTEAETARRPLPSASRRALCRQLGREGWLRSSRSLGRPLRPTGPAGALHLRDALEVPAAAQTGEMANTFGPLIDGVGRRPALQMHHLSMLEDPVRAQ